MIINNKLVFGDQFAYDGCHKIYIIEDAADEAEAKRETFDIYPIEKLPEVYADSCPLKFINNWKLDKTYCPQCTEAVFVA